MTKQEIMQEIITLIDELDQPNAESTPTKEPSRTALDNVLTTIYELCEVALIDIQFSLSTLEHPLPG